MSSDDFESARANHAGKSTLHPLWWVLAALLCLLPAIRAGDEPFVLDEPQLITKALIANAENRWESVGLLGSVGRPYGPLPIWIYQVALSFTSDPVQISQMRGVIVMAVTLFSACWIAQLIGVGGGWIVLIGLSPYLLHYARHLWDNSFNIPLAALAVALTLHTALRRAIWTVPVLVAVLGAMLLIHPMSLPLSAGIVVLLAMQARHWLFHADRQAIGKSAVALALILITGWLATETYRADFWEVQQKVTSMSDQPNGWWFALLSPRLLSAVWLDAFLTRPYLDAIPLAGLLSVATKVSSLMFLLAWAGAGLTIWQLPTRRDPATQAGLLALIVLAIQILLNGLTHTYGQPHYYNAVWIAPALLVAVTLKWIAQHRPLVWFGRVLVALIALSLATSVVLISQQLHATAGTRSPQFGVCLSEQVALVDQIRQYRGVPVQIDVVVADESIQALSSLWSARANNPAPTRQAKQLAIRYAKPSIPVDAHLILVEQP